MLFSKDKHATTICFVGIDGSGKTTQINWLLEKLRDQEKEVEYIHVLSSKSTLSGIIQEIAPIKPGVKKIRNLKKSGSGAAINLTIRVLNVLFDSYLTFYLNKFRYRGKVIIYDRYFYDILTIIAFSYTNFLNPLMKLSRLIPRPDIIAIIEVKPETAVERKPEHTLADAKKYCMLYEKLRKTLQLEPINGELDIEETRENLSKVFEKVLV
jgi:thymidylate kinase